MPTKSKASASPQSASDRIDQRIVDLGDWRGETLARMRALILACDADMIEEWKWMGTPVWSCDGIVCTGESYKEYVKLTFAKGAHLPDPSALFNASLEGNQRRAIDIREGDAVNVAAFEALVKAAVVANRAKKKSKRAEPTSTPVASKPTKANATSAKPAKRLAGGNPQIAKGDGDAPVQAYIEALAGSQRDVGRWLDALIVRCVPGVNKAVKWNSPFYGVEGKGWFLSLHAFKKYVKVAFFRGTSLKPMPPGESTSDETRYLDIRDGDALNEAQMTKWVKQAAKLPGWTR